MSQNTVAVQNRKAGPSLWLLSFLTVLLASGALLIIVWSPKALILASVVGAGALISRGLFQRVKVSAHARAEASSTVANAGLTLATIAVAPLIAFAFLWAALLVYLGMTWLLHAIGVI